MRRSFVHARLQHRQCVIHVGARDQQRWHETHRAHATTEQQQPIVIRTRHEIIAQLLRRRFIAMAGDEFHADHQPLTAHFADHRATRLPLAQPIQKVRADARRICRVVALHQIDRRQRGRAAQRISAIGVAVRAALPLLHPLLLRHHQPNRHAAAKALGERHDVRGDADMMRRKHSARATDARLHFVKDQHDAMPIAQLAQPAQKSLGGTR